MDSEYENSGRWAGALIALVALVVLALLVLFRFTGNAAEDIVISDQAASSGVQVERVYSDEAGYITVHEDNNGEPGEEIGRSELITENQENIFVPLSRRSMPDERLYIVYYVDNGDGIFDSEEDEMGATRTIVITEVSDDNESENGGDLIEDENDSGNDSFIGDFNDGLDEDNMIPFNEGRNEEIIPVQIVADSSSERVSLFNFNFSEENLTVEQNSVVEFTNEEGNHTVTVDGTGINHSLMEGESVSLMFNEIGTYHIYCDPHGEPDGGMHMTLFVVGNLSEMNETMNESNGTFAEDNFTMNDSEMFGEDNDSGVGSSVDVEAGVSDSGADAGIDAGADSGNSLY